MIYRDLFTHVYIHVFAHTRTNTNHLFCDVTGPGMMVWLVYPQQAPKIWKRTLPLFFVRIFITLTDHP